MADYTAQALVSTLLFHHFPSYSMVGEEDSSDLRGVSNVPIRNKIVEFANWALLEQPPADAADAREWQPIVSAGKRSEEQWLASIDKGNATTAAQGRARRISALLVLHPRARI